MQESFRSLSRVCASALLDAWYRNDAPQMREIAAGARSMSTVYTANPAESERLELLGGIAVELHRSSSRGMTEHVDPYLRLLLHLAHRNWPGPSLAHLN